MGIWYRTRGARRAEIDTSLWTEVTTVPSELVPLVMRAHRRQRRHRRIVAAWIAVTAGAALAAVGWKMLG